MDPLRPEPDAIHRARQSISDRGVVALPTDTLYGLAADPRSNEAVRRVFAIKGRSLERALPLVAADLEQVLATLGSLPPAGQVLASRFWPGPLTLIVPAPRSVAVEVHGGRGSVGVRVPAHAVTRAVCRAFGWPVTATSANVSGQPAPSDPTIVAVALGDAIDVLLDAGPTVGGLPSTIVDVTGLEPKLVRAGAIDWEQIHTCLHT